MRVAIIGTGLIGTSLALRLKREARTPLEIVGFDKYGDVLRAAKRLGAIDRDAYSAAEAVRDADLVILATPLLAIRELMKEIGPVLSPDAVITDTGSTKAEPMRWAREYLKGHHGWVGGHPMAGKTEFGPSAADPDLFEGARWVIVPAVNSSERALNTVTGLVEAMGARVMLMDAEEHDAYAAAISHLPMMAATAMFSMARASEAWPELSMLASGGFRDMTRLAGTDAAMAFDIALTNRQNIAHWIERFIGSLEELKDRLLEEEGEEDLFKLIAATEFEHSAYRNGKVGREESGTVPADMNYGFQDFLTGSWVREKMNEIMQAQEDRVREVGEENRSRRNI